LHWVLAGISLGPSWHIGLTSLLSTVVWLYRHRNTVPTWLDTGSPIYFSAAGLLSLLAPDFWATYGDVLVGLAMAGIWMGTLATGTPPTAECSRWSYRPELARDSLFVRTNAILTAFWAAVFMVQIVLALAGAANPARERL
jgi:hypothetical protein